MMAILKFFDRCKLKGEDNEIPNVSNLGPHYISFHVGLGMERMQSK